MNDILIGLLINHHDKNELIVVIQLIEAIQINKNHSYCCFLFKIIPLKYCTKRKNIFCFIVYSNDEKCFDKDKFMINEKCNKFL